MSASVTAIDHPAKIKRTDLLLAILVAGAYLCLLLFTYRDRYFAPDVRLYQSWGEQHAMARDGYSTLFIRISSLIGPIDPAVFIWLSAALMAGAMGAFVFVGVSVARGFWTRLLVVAGICSSGIWYYLFGKTYYDFPFTIFICGGCLILLWRLRQPIPIASVRGTIFLLSALGGFMLSWKPYNVFECWALLCAAVSHRGLRGRMASVYRSPVDVLRALGFGLAGFTLGNYGLLIRPLKTLDGIRASSYHADLWKFLFTTTGPAWDGVNFSGFHDAVLVPESAVLILFVLPAIARAHLFLISATLTTSLFLVFIRYFTPGFPWHGFTLGTYAIVALIFLSDQAESLEGPRRVLFKLALAMSVSLQVTHLANDYVPKQIRWIRAMDQAVATLTEQAGPIFGDVRSLADALDGTFDVVSDVKRLGVVKSGGYHLLAPVYQTARPRDWGALLNRSNVTYLNPTYLIRIRVDGEAALADVLPLFHIPFYYRLVSSKRGEDYTVSLYEKHW